MYRVFVEAIASIGKFNFINGGFTPKDRAILTG